MDTILANSAIKYFFTHNPNDVRWETYCNAVSLDKKLPDTIDKEISPYLWFLMHEEGYNNTPPSTNIHNDFRSFINDVAIYHRNIFSEPFDRNVPHPPITLFEIEADKLRKKADKKKVDDEEKKKRDEIITAAIPVSVTVQQNFDIVEKVLKAFNAEFGNVDLNKWFDAFKKLHTDDKRTDAEIYDAFWFEVFENTNSTFISTQDRAKLAAVKNFETFYREFKRVSLAEKDPTDPKYKYAYIMIQEFIKHPQTIKFAKLDDEFDNYAKTCNINVVPAGKTIVEIFNDFLDKLKNNVCTGIAPQKTYAIADDKEVEKIEKVKKVTIGTAAKQQKLRIRWDEWVKSYKMKFKYPTETSAIVYVLNNADLNQTTFMFNNNPIFTNITQLFATSLHGAFPNQPNTQIIDASLLAYTHKIKTEQNRNVDILDLYELVRSLLETRIVGARANFDNFVNAYGVAQKIITAIEKSTSAKFNSKIIDMYHTGNNNDTISLPAFEAHVNDALLLAVWKWIMMQTKIYAADTAPDFKWKWFESVTRVEVVYDPVLEKYEKVNLATIPPASPIDSFIALFTDPYVYVGEIFKYISQMPIGMFGKTIIVELNKWLSHVIKNPLGFKRVSNVNQVFDAMFKEYMIRINSILVQPDTTIIGMYDTFITTPGVNVTLTDFDNDPNFVNGTVPRQPYLAIPAVLPPLALRPIQSQFKTFLLNKFASNVAFIMELEKIYSDPSIVIAINAVGIDAALALLWAPNNINNNPIKKTLTYFVANINTYVGEFNAAPVPIVLVNPPTSAAYGKLGRQYISNVTNKNGVVGQRVHTEIHKFIHDDIELHRAGISRIDDPIILYEFFIYLTTLDIYKVESDNLYKALLEVVTPNNIDTDDVWSVMKLIIQNSTDPIELYSVIIAYNDYLIITSPPHPLPYNGSQNKQHTALFKAHLIKRLGKPIVDKIYNVIYPPKPITLYIDFLNELNGIGDSQLVFRNKNKRSPINTYLDTYDFVVEYSTMKGPGNQNAIDVTNKWKQYYDADRLKLRNIKEDYMIHLYDSKEAKNYVKKLRDKYNVTPPAGSDTPSLDAFTRSVWTPPINFIPDFLVNEGAKNIMVGGVGGNVGAPTAPVTGGGRINEPTDPMATFRREIIDNFNNLKQNEKDFYEKFIEIITVSGITVKLGTRSNNWENCYVVLRKSNADNPVPIFSEYIPNDDNIRTNDYLGVYNTGTLPSQYVVKTQFDLNFNKLVLPIITPKNTKLINKAGRAVRVDEQNNPVQFNGICNGTLFHGREIECEQFYKICITNPDLNKCTDMLRDSYFENAKNPNFVNEMNPETALKIVKSLGFTTVIVYDTFTKCMRKKIESVAVWKNRNFEVLKNKKNITMFYKYLDSIVNYINEYSFILNAEPCHQESPMFSPYYPMFGGGSPTKQLVLYIKFNRHNRKEQVKSQQPVKVNSDELIQTITNLLTNFFDDLVKQNVKFSYTDIEKINKYLHRIADCTENLAKVSAKLKELKQLHNIVQTTPSVAKSEYIMNEVGGKCKYCSDKISSAEKKLLLVINKLIG